MGSVHASTRPSLPITAATARTATIDATSNEDTSDDSTLTGNTFLDTLDQMGRTSGAVFSDMGTVSGITVEDDRGTHANLPTIIGGTAAVTGGSALVGLASQFNRTSAVGASFGVHEVGAGLASGGAIAAGSALRITPTLVSAIVGPAAADGITAIAPNLVKKKIDVSKITDPEKKKQATANNQWSTYSRIVAGGVVVGAVALGVFLIKPDLFKKFGAGLGINGGLVTEKTLQGTTTLVTGGGASAVVKGIINPTSTRATLAAAAASVGVTLAKNESIQVVKTVGAAAHSASASWRAAIAVGGGLGTLLLANKAAGAEGDEKRNYTIAAAAAGVATLGAFGATGAVVRALEGKGGAAKLITGFKPLHGPGEVKLFGAAAEASGLPNWVKKINWQWFKNYGAIAGITAVPAGTAAGQYYNLFNGDLDQITRTGSPWRK